MLSKTRFVVGIGILSSSGFGGHIAISGCRSLSQSPGDTLFGLAVVENPRLTVGISTLSVIFSGITISGFGGHIAIPGCRSASSTWSKTPGLASAL